MIIIREIEIEIYRMRCEHVDVLDSDEMNFWCRYCEQWLVGEHVGQILVSVAELSKGIQVEML